MITKTASLVSLSFVLLQLVAVSSRIEAATPIPAMIFCNGGMASPGALTQDRIDGFRASGMNTMVIFNMYVAGNGDFIYGGTICSNGIYVGPSNWGSLLNQCRAQPSTITRIEICIGGWGDPSWGNIQGLIAANGTGSGTVLYQNLLALKNALGIDAIDNDDEATYDAASTIQFGQMCAAIGLKSTLCPYTAAGYWQAVKAGLGTNCDEVYLQCYDGGQYNDPTGWNTLFGGLKVVMGYWDWSRGTVFLDEMRFGQATGCNGGFLWPSCTGCDPPADGNEMNQYAGWIMNSFNPLVMPVNANDVVGGQVTFAASFGGNNSYQWQVVRNGVTNNIAGATSATLTLLNLQLTNTALYQVQASNAAGVFVSSAASLTVSNLPAAVNNVVASYAGQTGWGYDNFTPTWPFTTNDSLIAGQSPSSVGSGSFTLNMAGKVVSELTAGDSLAISPPFSADPGINYLTCGTVAGGAGQSVTYTLTGPAAGCNLTNITVYGGWKDAGRDQQAYTVYYSQVSAPSSFIFLGTVSYNPPNPASVQSATRVTLTAANGILATNVAAVQFDFTTPPCENDWVGYAEIALYGIPISPMVTMNTLPVTAADVVGSQVTFTAAFSAISPLSYQWQKIIGGVTNNIAGATNTTLSLTNLQLNDTASYQLRATNAFGIVLSSPAPLTVSSVPGPQNNVIAAYAAQTGPNIAGLDFIPTWTVAPGSLISGQSPGGIGGGSFTQNINLLTDGTFGSLPAGGGVATEVTCGSGAGQSVTYVLNGSTNSYNLTNIVIYGGWSDGGRDQQAYTIYYSTVIAPTSFNFLTSVSYNPPNAAGGESATRATLTPASGVLAANVAAVLVDFTTPPGKNGYEGYSEIQLFGSAAPPGPIVPYLVTNTLPATAADVVGSQVAFTAAFTGSSPIYYQWQVIKGGMTNNIAGATNTALTLSNLQLSDTAAYRLQASNAGGMVVSAARPLTVTTVPGAVNNVIASYAAQTGLGSAMLNFTPTWTVTPGSLIAGQAPSSVGSGNFTYSTALLTDGSYGFLSYAISAPTTSQITGGSGAGQSVTYTIGNSPNGYNISNIVVYGGWCDLGRDAQQYTVSYSTVASPATFTTLGVANYDPPNPLSVQSATRSTLSPATGGLLASNVVALMFDFTTPAPENGYVGYSEIGVYGTSIVPIVMADTLPATAADVVGSQVTFTAAISGASPVAYQWKKINGGVTNAVIGATSPTLTLSNLQLSDSASYQLRATNIYGVAASSPSALVVSSVPAPVNNVIVSMAAQTGYGGNTTFPPTWTLMPNSLIAGLAPSSSSGNFSLDTAGKTVNELTDGGTLAIGPSSASDNSINYIDCGNGSGAGSLVIYTLPGIAGGYSLTNITVYGGWCNDGRDRQTYTLYYSKISAPGTFVSLGNVYYEPVNPLGVQSATRATWTAANGILATNVAAVMFDFTTPAAENGYVGYAEIAMFGKPTQVVATNPTNIVFQVTANTLQLGWPGDHTGWQLEEQTNSVTQGLGTNWFNVAGSTLTNQMTFPINPANGSIFYRLYLP